MSAFAKAGSKGIVLVARTADTLETVTQEIHDINKDIEILTIPMDLGSTQAIIALWDKVKEKFGHADILTNNAGSRYEKRLIESSSGLWWKNFVN